MHSLSGLTLEAQPLTESPYHLILILKGDPRPKQGLEPLHASSVLGHPEMKPQASRTQERAAKSPESFNLTQGGGGLFVCFCKYSTFQFSCYSGGFIRKLKLDAQIIMRQDVASSSRCFYIGELRDIWHLSKITIAGREKGPRRYVAVICICTCVCVHCGVTESRHLRVRSSLSIPLFQPLPCRWGKRGPEEEH